MKYGFLYYSDVFYKINFAILYLYNLISGGYLFFMRFFTHKIWISILSKKEESYTWNQVLLFYYV